MQSPRESGVFLYLTIRSLSRSHLFRIVIYTEKTGHLPLSLHHVFFILPQSHFY